MASRAARSAAPVRSPVPAAPPRKPNATARRVNLFEREVRFKLSGPAIDILFQLAKVLSEGQRAGTRYFGSVMITIDLGCATGLVREACDSAGARRVADLVSVDPRARERARALAEAEATRLAGLPFARLDIDLRARALGNHVHIDLDFEGDLAPPRR